MQTLQCTHRDFTIIARVFEHPGLPTPYAGGCQIIAPDGRSTRRQPLPTKMAFLADLDAAQHASIAHGKWLVDQSLDSDRDLFH
jgi:hypothetical protein